jgi:hypothetical protein
MLAVGVLLILFSGCGGSGSRKSASFPTGTIKYLGGAHNIVSGKLPAGAPFSIVGQRYLFMGHHYLELRAHFAKPAQAKEGSSDWSRGSGGLEWGTTSVCDVRPFVIVYGLLKPPNYTAYTQIDGKLVEFQKAPLPGSLHTTGALFYGTSSSPVRGLIIRSRTGQPLANASNLLIIEPSEGVCGHSRHPSAELHRLTHLRHAIAQIAQCLRRHGFDVTNPNLTEPGPVFNTHATNTKSAPYIAAKATCVKEALPALRASLSAHSHTSSTRASP